MRAAREQGLIPCTALLQAINSALRAAIDPSFLTLILDYFLSRC